MNNKLLTIYKLLKMKEIRPVNQMVCRKINGRTEYILSNIWLTIIVINWE
jgi:hypothetical protein